MPICSYLVFPSEGATRNVAERLSAIEGCDVEVARNRNVLILVTESRGEEEEREMRKRIEGTEGIRAVVLTFGELDAEPATS